MRIFHWDFVRVGWETCLISWTFSVIACSHTTDCPKHQSLQTFWRFCSLIEKNKNKNKTKQTKSKTEEKKPIEFCGSRLSHLLYSQNIQRGPPLGKCQEVPWRFALQFWCLSNALTLRVRALDASKSQCACIILSKFTCKSKYAVRAKSKIGHHCDGRNFFFKLSFLSSQKPRHFMYITWINNHCIPQKHQWGAAMIKHVPVATH